MFEEPELGHMFEEPLYDFTETIYSSPQSPHFEEHLYALPDISRICNDSESILSETASDMCKRNECLKRGYQVMKNDCMDDKVINDEAINDEAIVEDDTVKNGYGKATCNELDKELDNELGKELDNELDKELDNELGKELDNELDNELDTKLDKELDTISVPEYRSVLKIIPCNPKRQPLICMNDRYFCKVRPDKSNIVLNRKTGQKRRVARRPYICFLVDVQDIEKLNTCTMLYEGDNCKLHHFVTTLQSKYYLVKVDIGDTIHIGRQPEHVTIVFNMSELNTTSFMCIIGTRTKLKKNERK